MFIIFGSTGREMNEKTGQFNCPNCCLQHYITKDEKQQKYTQIKVANYFTLFFIPIFSYQTLGRYRKCNHCHSEYDENVLEYVPPTFEQQIEKDVEQELKSGTPISMMINKLKMQGLDDQQATKLVDQIVSGNIATCHHCKIEFLKCIERCPLCEGYLSK